MTKMLNNIGESYFNTLQAKLTANNYSNVKLLNSFPKITDPSFTLPSISIEWLTTPPKESADLGIKNRKIIVFIVNIFAEDDFQKADLVDIIMAEWMEKESLDILDYLPGAGQIHLNYGRFENINAKPLRGNLEADKYRTQITFDVTYLENV